MPIGKDSIKTRVAKVAAEAPTETDAPKGGCKSALGGMALLLVAGAALGLGKKRD